MVKRLQKECRGGEKASRRCPECHSNRINKDWIEELRMVLFNDISVESVATVGFDYVANIYGKPMFRKRK